MPDINIPSNSIPPMGVTLYYREYGLATKFGGFMLIGDVHIIDRYVGSRLKDIPMFPPVPDPYGTFVLKQIGVVNVINEMLLVFEKGA